MKYSVKPLSILAIPSTTYRINETKLVHPTIQKYLKSEGYEVHHERLAFRVPYYPQRVLLRVDFLALKQQEILIVECKGCPFAAKSALGALLQLSLYMRVYKMTREIHNPQMSLFDGFDENLARDGKVRGILAIPYFDAERELNEAAQYLDSVQLAESDIEVWNLASTIYAMGGQRA